jgi:hypothetical protein
MINANNKKYIRAYSKIPMPPHMFLNEATSCKGKRGCPQNKIPKIT